VTESNPASSLLAPFIENLYRMAWIVEARDPYTGGHLWRVSQYARMLPEDLGRVGIPDAVLVAGAQQHLAPRYRGLLDGAR
jgi:response regulator RpfG family c-di-GMP phosphodiesterase